eukprot:163364_1
MPQSDNMEMDLESEDYKNKKKLTHHEKKELLFEYCHSNKRCPKQVESYKNVCIGHWLADQKRNITSKQDALYIKLAKNEYVKQSLDQYLCTKNKNKNKPKMTSDEKMELLFEYCNVNKLHPQYNTLYKNV